MAKPFSIQSPEDIAMEYGGNKQKIAQAMQLGVVDPTAGVLAGMFIDRMRSAQMQEQAPQTTVAQQVMGGVPPVPPTAPSGGLGATPQAAPPMAPPQMGMPPEAAMAPPQEAPMGMAEGGIAGLDIPDTMYDEPTNGGFDDGYSGGGLVAFAGGGDLDLAELRRALRAQESSGDYGVMNAEGSGAMGAYQFMPRTARALAKRLGLPYRPELMQGEGGRSKEGVAYQERLMDEQLKDIAAFSKGDPKLAAAYHFAGPNRKGWGKDTAKYQSDIMRRLGEDSPLPERDIQSPEGRRATFEDQLAVAKKRFAGLPDSGLGELEAYYREELAPEKREKARKDDMWMALAQIGASMAGTSSPNFLQAAGQALAATLPGVAASKKERKAAERDARTGLREVLGLKRGEQKEVLEFAKDLQAIEMGAENSELARKEAREAADLAFTRDKELEGIRAANRITEIETQGKISNSEYEARFNNMLGKLRARMAQGIQLMDPEGNPVGGRGQTLAEAELRALADAWVNADRYRYRGTGADPLGGLKPGEGAGGGGQPTVTNVGGWND